MRPRELQVYAVSTRHWMRCVLGRSRAFDDGRPALHAIDVSRTGRRHTQALCANNGLVCSCKGVQLMGLGFRQWLCGISLSAATVSASGSTVSSACFLAGEKKSMFCDGVLLATSRIKWQVMQGGITRQGRYIDTRYGEGKEWRSTPTFFGRRRVLHQEAQHKGPRSGGERQFPP